MVRVGQASRGKWGSSEYRVDRYGDAMFRRRYVSQARSKGEPWNAGRHRAGATTLASSRWRPKTWLQSQLCRSNRVPKMPEIVAVPSKLVGVRPGPGPIPGSGEGRRGRDATAIRSNVGDATDAFSSAC
jgi:hypothetical protein